MDQNVDDFHIFLPSNASMNYFPTNTPDRYRTKLAHPINLSGVWECSLAEATIPGKFFTIHENYNDDYYIEKPEIVMVETDRPEIKVSIYNEDNSDFIDGVNVNLQKEASTLLSLELVENRNLVNISLAAGWDLRITRKDGGQFLYALHQPQNKDATLYAKTDERHTITLPYRDPIGNLKKQFFTLFRRVPIVKRSYEIVVTSKDELSIFDEINSGFELVTGQNLVQFVRQENEIVVKLPNHVDLILEREKCPKLMNALNITTAIRIIRGNFIKGEIKFKYSKLANGLEDEKIKLNENELFTMYRSQLKMHSLKVSSGMYHDSKDFFNEFKDIKLEELPNNKVKLIVIKDIRVRFGEKLKDILGFTQSVFTEGEYISDYNLELTAGITEIYVYCDIVTSTLVGDSLAPILKVIPIANERGNQIVKHFSVPLYFRIKNQHFDSIEIEMRTSTGTPIKFISGKSSLVLSFRRKLI